MHDLDRAMFETGDIGHQPEHAEHDEHTEHHEFLEILGEQTDGETDQGEWEQGSAAVDQSAHEMELAAELLEVQTEEELDRFLGKLLSRAAGAARSFARSRTGRSLGGILKQAAGRALPVIGRGIGGALHPKYARTGARIGRDVKGWLGLELEGLSQEDREFELARAFVRFANAASRQAAQAPPGTSPQAAASAAATAAARRYLPGLLGDSAAGSTSRQARQQSGRWVRRGDQIVIYGA